MEQYDARGQGFLLNAAIAFGDACTRPKLTPTCPFYEEVDTGPTCDEQCRGIAESLGDTSRKWLRTSWVALSLPDVKSRDLRRLGPKNSMQTACTLRREISLSLTRQPVHYCSLCATTASI